MRILYLATAALLVTGGATACGSGGSSPAVSSSPTLGTAAKEAKARQFVECARKNGIPNVADPKVNADGDIDISPPPGLTKQSPIVQKVMKICGKYLDGVFTHENKDSSADYDKALKLSACVRQHGVPNFPDPSPPTEGEGSKMHIGKNLDREAVDKAMRACGVTPQPKPKNQ
ncbi:hypothetical protein NE236_29675 [Actinoallomurus purpureus]|uniref:hypothetical protein n=1 Tax=Actinoallomurus purpureus TaxID=478114 RepID=UPI00209276A8|nr:hypothetical protein [Actinoallomurus purpureus]MCO6009147.1 hypothetical protein [Actinoallomurus purpureus]